MPVYRTATVLLLHLRIYHIQIFVFRLLLLCSLLVILMFFTLLDNKIHSKENNM